MKRWVLVAATLVAARSAFGACSAPAGFTKAWNGTTTAWSTAANWTPAGVPANSDSVYICASAAAQPALTAATTVANLFVDSGASLSFAGFTLTATGNVDMASGTGGTLSMTGTKTLRGSVPNLSLPNSAVVTLNGATTVNGNFTLSDGDITIGGQTMTVTGSFTAAGLGDRLRMNNPADRLIVLGNVAFNGGGATGIMTAGELHVAGNFSENNACCTGTAFAPSGTHRTVFDGNKSQTVTFNNPSATNAFQDVEVAGSGTLVTSTTNANIRGNLIDPVGFRWKPSTTVIRGATPTLANIGGNVSFPATTALQNSFSINGDVSVTSALTINGQTLTITGNLTTSGLGDRLTMTNAADRLIVQGNVAFNGGGATGILTAGELHVGGNFSENNACCTGTAFAASGTHRTVFDGNKSQTVAFNNPSATNAFQDVEVAGSGTLVTSTTNANIRGNLIDPVGFRWKPSTTVIRGATPTLANIGGNVSFPATTALQNSFTVNGDVSVTSVLTINGQTLTITGDLTTSGLGDRFTMNTSADKVIVKGNANFNGGGATGILTAGELHLGGNFSENNACCTGTAFAPSGTHTTVFEGGTTQTVKFNNPSSTIGFQNVLVSTVGTIVTSTSGVVVKGNLADPIGNRWQASGTTFIGAAPSIANIKSNATFSSTTALQNDFMVDANVTVTGALTINGHTLTIGGNLTTSGLGDRLTMTNVSDRVIVKGNANFNGGGANGILTAGELHVGGNFTENNACCTGTAFVPSGTHTTVFDGIGAQAILFNNGATHFANLRLNGPAISLSSAVDATGALSSSGGMVSGAGRALSFAGLDVSGLTFDNVLVTSNGGALTRLDNATFQNYANSAAQLTIKHSGAGTPVQFKNNRFLSAPTTGSYITATDTATADGSVLTIQMINSTPTDGSALTKTTGGAVVQWLTVATNHNPAAANDSYSMDEDQQMTISAAAAGVLANDSDSDGDALTASIVTPPLAGTLDLRADGSFVYTPPRDFNGSASFIYRADDGHGGSANATVTIAVHAQNDPPAARDDSYMTSGRLTIAAPGVLFNDADIDGDVLTASVVTQPANGTLTLSSTGAFTYDPRGGFTGTDTFTYAASDASSQSTARVTITVTQSTAPPTVTFRATSSTIKSGDAVTLLWTTTNASTVTILPALGAQALNGSVSVSPAATTTYTLNATSPAGTTSAQLTIEVVSAASISVVQRPRGMLELPGATATDSFVIANLGGAASTVTITQSGQFFTQTPTTFSLAAGALQTITISAQAMPFGIYRGESVLSGDGVPAGLAVPIKLLSLTPPTGVTNASASSTRVDGGSTQTVSATFTNSGTATAQGLVVSDSPWIIPQNDSLTIGPGDSATTILQIDQTKRPDGAEPSGALTAGVSLMNIKSSSGKGFLAPNEVASVNVSTVAVKDLVPPPVSSASITPLAPGEVAYFVTGLAHRNNVVGDLSVVNRSSTSSLSGIKLFATTSGVPATIAQLASLPSLAPNVSFAMPDLMKGVFNQQSASGSVMVRGDVSKISVNASAASTGKGFFGGTIAPIRSDRGAAKGETQRLAGVAKDANRHTDLHLQETTGAAADAVIDFLDEHGALLTSRNESLTAFGYLERVDVAPAGTMSIRIRTTDASAGAIAAHALVVDQTTGDVTDVVDWTRVNALVAGETRYIPFAPRGTGQTTDLVLMNGGTAPVTIAVSSSGTGGGRRRAVHTSVNSIVLDAGETRVVHDAGGEGYLMINGMSTNVAARVALLSGTTTTALPLLGAGSALHTGEGRQFTGIEDASASSVSDARPGTFRSSFGFAEVAGAPVSVRATVHYTYAGAKASLRAVASKDFALGAGKPLVVADLVKAIIGNTRNDYGDLHDVQLDIDVVGGDGAVIPFVMSVDNATGDMLFRWE